MKRICRTSRTNIAEAFVDVTDSEDNNSFADSNSEDDENEPNLNVIDMKPNVSVQTNGGSETIFNFRKWLKSPWTNSE